MSDPGTDTTPDPDPGTEVSVSRPADQQEELDKLMGDIADVADMTPAELADRYDAPFASSLGYEPKDAEFLDLLQASSLALDASDMEKLGANGFVISDKKKFPTFGYGYNSIYALDLPVYISADSILYAVHRSYDKILETTEQNVLIPELRTLLASMRTSLSNGGATSLGDQARADADFFVAVAMSLLDDALAPPVAGSSGADIQAIVDMAKQASGAKTLELFGAKREVDFSQFKPRGHYTHSEELGRYFRAMMWLGRIDLRFLEPDELGNIMFHRRQLEGAFALGELLDGASADRWTRIDDVIRAFVGEPDYMVVTQLDALKADLGVADPGEIAAIPDNKVAQAILDGGYGAQRIASQIMVNGIGKGTMPLASSFAFFGQRYVLDSHVFSNVVYDRVQGGKVMRMMPDPLDVGFAALGNNQAGHLLLPQLDKYSYAPDLAAMRILADAHGDAYWTQNLYNLWMSSLRTLSPTEEVSDPAANGLPAVAGTEPWGRRLLNTQLASWAELRHDTILYAKQSYTEGSSCEFPDAYVDPYPKLYEALAAYADHGKALVTDLEYGQATWLKPQLEAHFDKLSQVVKMLGSMAESERTGMPFNEEQMAFVNQTVKLQEGCGSPSGIEGWYAGLFFSPESAVVWDPTIADVHTQPTDESGNTVGKVLHVGTGAARLLVVTANTCVGPRAYVGVASSYFEKITESFERLDDPTWSKSIETDSPEDVPWMQDIVVR